MGYQDRVDHENDSHEVLHHKGSLDGTATEVRDGNTEAHKIIVPQVKRY